MSKLFHLTWKFERWRRNWSKKKFYLENLEKIQRKFLIWHVDTKHLWLKIVPNVDVMFDQFQFERIIKEKREEWQNLKKTTGVTSLQSEKNDDFGEDLKREIILGNKDVIDVDDDIMKMIEIQQEVEKFDEPTITLSGKTYQKSELTDKVLGELEGDDYTQALDFLDNLK